MNAVYVPRFSEPLTCKVLAEENRENTYKQYKIKLTARHLLDQSKPHAYRFGEILFVPGCDIFDRCRFIKSGGATYASGRKWLEKFNGETK